MAVEYPKLLYERACAEEVPEQFCSSARVYDVFVVLSITSIMSPFLQTTPSIKYPNPTAACAGFQEMVTWFPLRDAPTPVSGGTALLVGKFVGIRGSETGSPFSVKSEAATHGR